MEQKDRFHSPNELTQLATTSYRRKWNNIKCYLIKPILAQGTASQEKGSSRLNVSITLKRVRIILWTRNWRINQWHICPALVEICNAVCSSNFRTETWPHLSCLQLLPVDWLEPFMVPDFITSLQPTAKPFSWVLLQQLEKWEFWLVLW